MLVLTRKLGEEIVIGGDIRVVIVRCDGNKVRVAVDAPADVPVDRREVHDPRQGFAQPAAAAQPNPACAGC
jgi:carbon storage regulator